MTVPEDPDGPEDLAVLAGTDMTVPATAIGEREGDGDGRDAGGQGEPAGDDLDVSRRTIRSWLGDLGADPGEYYLR